MLCSPKEYKQHNRIVPFVKFIQDVDEYILFRDMIPCNSQHDKSQSMVLYTIYDFMLGKQVTRKKFTFNNGQSRQNREKVFLIRR